MIQRYGDKVPRIHPTAWVHPSAVVVGDVWLGPRVGVWPGAILRGDCGAIRIGEDTNLQDGAIIHTTQDVSETHVGARVTVGHAAVLHGCRVGDDCLIGMHSTLLDNSAIGAHSIVAAAALVSIGKVFPPRSLVAGSPAALVREVNARNLAQIDYGWRAYLRYREPFLDGTVVRLPDDFSFWPDDP